jgi:hypothetical protein
MVERATWLRLYLVMVKSGSSLYHSKNKSMSSKYIELREKLDDEGRVLLDELINQIKWSAIDDMRNTFDFFTKQ